MRESVGVVGFMPVVLDLVKLAFFELVVLILWCFLCVEEAHKRTVCYEWHNTLCLIVPKLQTTNPYEDDKIAIRIK